MSEPTNASRPQPPPIDNTDERPVVDYVVADIQERAEAGHRKYGMYLKTHNGRDPLWDAYQEAIDLVMYLRQELLRRGEL